ncbi:3'-5' exoribonuclease [Patescibacteria group bacterium AH-259-L07]|nr:3'-5' exoribonuclease [Patescibacteria group bacterium AH-259-L07]
MQEEVYISVDIEASGPAPAPDAKPMYSMVSLGACVVGNTSQTFYRELKPTTDTYTIDALTHCSFSDETAKRIQELGGGPEATMAALSETGNDPQTAMRSFAYWVLSVSGKNRPVFVGFNATFDWMFVHPYFHRFLGKSPFGISGLDIKSYYMGMMRCRWAETTKRRIDKRFRTNRRHTHHALDDAIGQAQMFEKFLQYQKQKD